jgi:hypothetical protein
MNDLTGSKVLIGDIENFVYMTSYPASVSHRRGAIVSGIGCRSGIVLIIVKTLKFIKQCDDIKIKNGFFSNEAETSINWKSVLLTQSGHRRYK